MYVTKRNGEKEKINFDTIKKRNEEIANKLNLNIDVSKLSQAVIRGLTNGINTTEID